MESIFSFNLKSSLLLLFFFQGFVFSILAFRNGYANKNKASKWLSLLLFLYAMYLVPFMLGYADWYRYKPTREFLYFIPFMQVFLIGPVIYFYTKHLLNKDYKLSRKDYLHFIPALLYAVYSFIVFVMDKLILDEYYFYANDRDKDLADWYQWSGVISMTFYLVISIRFYSRYKNLVLNKVSYADKLLFQWIRNFLAAFIILIVLRVLHFALNPEWGQFGNKFWYYIAFSIVFYYIAITGYSNSVKQIVYNSEDLDQINVFQEEKEDMPIVASQIQNAQNQEILHLIKPLSDLMKSQELFMNPRLTLIDVAQQLGTTSKSVSQLVNSQFKMNFNDYVNGQRVEALKKKLIRGEHQTKTLMALAFECGFNSKSTFNRAFKKNTGQSPKEFLKNSGQLRVTS